MPSANKKVYVILGSTGSGKTKLVECLDAKLYEIISCDTRQIYQGLEKTTAAPNCKQRSLIPYHFISCLKPTEKMTAGNFAEKSHELIQNIHSRNKIPVLVGGAGFYYQALARGMFGVKTPPEIRAFAEKLSHEERLALLQEKNPKVLLQENEENTKRGIHPRDVYRVQRALEIFLSSKMDWQEHWDKMMKTRESKKGINDVSFKGFRILTDRDELWTRLEERVISMLDKDNIVDEVIAIYNQYGDCAALETMGCQEIMNFYNARINKNELISQLFIKHRQYAKRQRIWLQRENELKWISFEELKKYLEENGGQFTL